jgi:prolyl-tRNA synthetase
MIRAGLIRQLVAGAYVYLPLGWRVLQKVTAIIREEMNAAGAIELHMPAMHPLELWRETGRDGAMGDTLIHLPDQAWRSGIVLGPTHEEVITDVVRSFINSYKQLPINLYQIQTKFRDEKRPKSGVLRTREFLMKDAYSFDRDLDGLNASYQKMYDAYCRIFRRSGLPFVAVEAESGAIGGDVSHEFMVRTDAGEDVLVRTSDGRYAANVERAAVAAVPHETCPPLQDLAEVHTPGLGSVEQVSRFLCCRPQDMITTIIFMADGQPLAALVRGDHEVNEAKLRKAAGCSVLAPADPETILRATGARVGFAGPVGLKVRVIADQAVAVMHNAVTGANKTDYHLRGVNPRRDFQTSESGDIRYAVEGDRSPDGQPLIFEKCIEVGHVFKLGTKYSAAMKAHFLDDKGQSRPCVMGCYGIGANRIIAAAIEAHHGPDGIIWPMSIAPFQVLVCCLDPNDAGVAGICQRVHDELSRRGLDVLLDDRDLRPGPKFKDADLIGIPLRITVGRKSLEEKVVELKRLGHEGMDKLPAEAAIETAARLVQEGLHALTR